MKYQIPITCEKIKDFPSALQPTARKLLRIGRAYVKDCYTRGYEPGWPEKSATLDLRWEGRTFNIPYYVFGIDTADQAMIYKLRDHLQAEFSQEISEGSVSIDASGFMD